MKENLVGRRAAMSAARKTKRRTRSTMRPGKPDTARLSMERIGERRRIESRKAKAELDPKTKRPKR
jgi:hypothetical protein